MGYDHCNINTSVLVDNMEKEGFFDDNALDFQSVNSDEADYAALSTRTTKSKHGSSASSSSHKSVVNGQTTHASKPAIGNTKVSSATSSHKSQPSLYETHFEQSEKTLRDLYTTKCTVSLRIGVIKDELTRLEQELTRVESQATQLIKTDTSMVDEANKWIKEAESNDIGKEEIQLMSGESHFALAALPDALRDSIITFFKSERSRKLTGTQRMYEKIIEARKLFAKS